MKGFQPTNAVASVLRWESFDTIPVIAMTDANATKRKVKTGAPT